MDWTALWILLGLTNVLLGARVALAPSGSRDLRLVRSWAHQAVVNGVNPYRNTVPADYPPWALAGVSPLLVVPAPWLPAFWLLANIALGVSVAWLGFKALGVDSRPPLGLAAGSLLAWAAVRIGVGNGQFALLAVAAGLSAVCLARSGSPWSSGLLLGLALIKPHVGVAFAAWAAFERRFTVLLIGLITIVVATLVFSARVHELPTTAWLDYVRMIGGQLGGSPFIRGSTEVRPLLNDVIGNPGLARTLTFVFIGVALVAIAMTIKSAPGEDRTGVSLPLACLWALTSAFHNTYDLVLLWPVWVALWVRERDGSAGRRRQALLLVQAVLMAGIPGLSWTLTEHPILSANGFVGAAAAHFDRALVLGLLVYFVRAHRRPHAQGSPVEAKGRCE